MLRLQELHARFISGLASDEEIEEWRNLLKLPENREKALELFRDVYGMEPFADVNDAHAENMLHQILQMKTSPADLTVPSPVAENAGGKLRFFKTVWFRYAAIIALVLVAGGYAWERFHQANAGITATHVKLDVLPGMSGAVLTLADGSQVVLDSLSNRQVAMQNGIRVLLKNGQLVYDVAGIASGELAYNTMTTPKGRQFNITLPDGTKVWLNAASSLRYPTAFMGRQRRVEVSGEAYFEVAKDKAMPFFVSVNKQAGIQVLGTSFAVNAYDDNASINTTLINGSVKVINHDDASDGLAGIDKIRSAGSVILKPGQQANIYHTGKEQQELIGVSAADIEKATAWKNGIFYFEGLTLKEAMMQLSRWYDIDVIYSREISERGMQNLLLAGEIRMGLSLAEVVELLNGLGLQFNIADGRKLLVSP